MTATALTCPACSGPMWDETKSKYYKPGRPIAKCKDKACDGVLWAPKTNGATAPQVSAPQAHNFGARIPDLDDSPAVPHAQIVGEKLSELFNAYTAFFAKALDVALGAQKTDKEIVVTLEGVNAIAATMWITAKDKGLV